MVHSILFSKYLAGVRSQNVLLVQCFVMLKTKNVLLVHVDTNFKKRKTYFWYILIKIGGDMVKTKSMILFVENGKRAKQKAPEGSM